MFDFLFFTVSNLQNTVKGTLKISKYQENKNCLTKIKKNHYFFC